jgi:hypothetical protein
LAYRGKVRNGAIVLDPGVELPEGTQVRIELDLSEVVDRRPESDPLFRMTDLAVETGISDLATNADHYLYGHPRQSDGK